MNGKASVFIFVQCCSCKQNQLLLVIWIQRGSDMNNQVIISSDTGLGNSSCIFSAPWEFRQAALSIHRDLVRTVAVYKRVKQMEDAYRYQNKEK